MDAVATVWRDARSSTSSRGCCCWSSSRRSTSGRCSSRAGAWRSAGIPTRAAGQAGRARAPPAGDQRGGRPARAPGRGLARRQGVRATPSRSAPPRRASARAEEGARAYEAEQRARAHAEDRKQTTRSARASPTTRSCTATRAASPTPSGASARVTGIYFSGEGDDVAAVGAREVPAGVRTVPAGSLQFVDFSKPDPAADRVQRFMTAAQHAMAEGDYELAAQRLVYARDAEPRNPAVLRLMTVAFWQAGNLAAAGARRARLGARRGRPSDAAPLRRAHLRGHGRARARREAAQRGDRARAQATRRPGSALGRLRLRLERPRGRAGGAGARARARADGRGPARPRAVPPARRRRGRRGVGLRGATLLAPESAQAWSRYAHALARTDRVSEAIAACERALALAPTRRSRRCSGACASARPRVLPESAAA